MPRVSREAKAASHEKIIKIAAHLFREKGIEATSVADIMSAAGMTHGGFYRHFASKEDLAAAAIDRGFHENLEHLIGNERQAENADTLAAFVERYLSDQHVGDPGNGCPIVALAAETARGSSAGHTAIAEGVDAMVARLADLIRGDKRQTQEKAAVLLALLVGTVTLLRTAPSQEFQTDIRASAHTFIKEHLDG